MKLTKSLILGIAAFLMAVAPVSAISVPTPRVPDRANQFEQRPLDESRCNLVNGKIDNLLSGYEERKERHIQRYNGIQQNVAELITKLQEEGIDTTNLENDLAQLQVLIEEFRTYIESSMERLRAARTQTCGDDQSQFRAEVEAARGELLKAREVALEIRTFVFDVLRPDIQTIRDQIKSQEEQ